MIGEGWEGDAEEGSVGDAGIETECEGELEVLGLPG